MRVLGFDIGGANIKAATAEARTISRPFPIWKTPENLAAELRLMERQLSPAAEAFAVTMTAELADCFATKADGVAHIVNSVVEVAGSRPVLVWMTNGQFASPAESVQRPLLAAASNWQALATWAARLVNSSPTLLIDIGTTTTDVIPIINGTVATSGTTDVTRLLAGELIYTGSRRTPLCAIAPCVPFRGARCPLSAEVFATTLDVYLWLGLIEEAPDDVDTANGRPAIKTFAHDRLARQLCCDREELDATDATAIAHFLMDQQRLQITRAIDQVLQRHAVVNSVILSGSGSFLARPIIAEHPRFRGACPVDLSAQLSPAAAAAACAYAIAVLAEEYLRGLRN